MAEALVSCGIDPLAVDVEWDGLCQEHVLTFKDQSYPAETLEALVELSLTFSSRIVFGSRALQETYEKALMASPRVVQAEARFEQYKSQLIEGAGLRDFPPYNPENETLADFATRAGLACGFGEGSVQIVSGSAFAVDPTRVVQVGPQGLMRLIALLEYAAPEHPINLLGSDAASPPA